MRYLIIIIVFIFFSTGANSKIKNDRLWIQSYNDCHEMYNDPRIKNNFSKQAHSNYCKCNVNLIFENFTVEELKIINNQMRFKAEKDRIKILQLNEKSREIATYCSNKYLR